MNARAIQEGGKYFVDNNADKATLYCQDVIQRNWSRVGIGCADGNEGGEPKNYFIKQNISRSGDFLPLHWKYEREGVRVARKLLQDIVNVPDLSYENESLALNIFEYFNIIPLDELLRTNQERFDRCFLEALPKTVQILKALCVDSPCVMPDNLPVKERGYFSAGNAVNFKGIDIRNIAVCNDKKYHGTDNRLVMFDFGRPYLAPVEEAAAKLFVSIGLLNWGRPVKRFIKGPDASLLEKAYPYFEEFLTAEAIRAELELQFRFRTDKYHGASESERIFKKLGINTLGARYFSALERLCVRYISG